MEDTEYLYLIHHDPETCATCRARRGEPMVCAICHNPFTPEAPTVLCYTGKETPPHYGTIHAYCHDGASDDTFIRY